MAISKKPKKENVKIDDLINKGGSVPSEKKPKSKPDEDKIIPVQLRLKKKELDYLDNHLNNRPFKIPRHTWIIQAIQEKLDRDING